SLPFIPFNLPATPDIYTLSLHDALPILLHVLAQNIFIQADHGAIAEQVLRPLFFLLSGLLEHVVALPIKLLRDLGELGIVLARRSEEHTSELQSRENLVCRLLLEKKKQK